MWFCPNVYGVPVPFLENLMSIYLYVVGLQDTKMTSLILATLLGHKQ